MVAGIIGALVLLYVLYNSASGTAVQVAAPSGPSDAEVNAATQVQLGQLQANTANNQLGAQLTAQQNNNATAVTLAGLDAQTAHYQVEQSANVQSLGITAQENIQLAGFQTQQQIAIANDATQAQIAMISGEVTKTGYQESTKQLQSVENANVAVTQSNNQTQLGIVQAVQKTQQKSSDNGFFGSLLGTVGSVLAFL
jgi:hypothetical protein